MLSFSLRRTSPLGAACALLLALSGCHDGKGTSSAHPLPEVGVATVAPRTIRLANETGFPHAGTVDFLDNRLDPQTGTIRARVRLPNADHTFTPGLYARVQLVSGRDQDALLVDDKAVLTDQDRKYVYVIGPGDKALRRDVTIGRELDGERIVEKGLQSGDRVVVDGVQRIYYPGAQVKPKALPARADAGNATQALADAGAPAAQ
ncbi:efflux RND transporter periplasmic adaptor subunit [Burkholderia cenocepacia]|uniref:efflux RND transporter periplasmic adaptor subunit n=1 Tax=Burkholderia cenocepacia TaxID=95486 RepID=UPI001AA123D9|nr:efflux RND transporter periplasmic adaptor subunit [Burkholderia cenocepacia]MBO1857213.1 efflux RND transporter periplasmic adaptor subunit [Burkholderia cenocepacia]